MAVQSFGSSCVSKVTRLGVDTKLGYRHGIGKNRLNVGGSQNFGCAGILR